MQDSFHRSLDRALANTTRVELDAIKARDRAVVARIGNPERDPLLRAEMDRRLLLRQCDEAIEALNLIVEWCAGPVKIKPSPAREYDFRLPVVVEDLAHQECPPEGVE